MRSNLRAIHVQFFIVETLRTWAPHLRSNSLEHIPHEVDESWLVQAGLNGRQAVVVLVLEFGLGKPFQLLVEIPILQEVDNGHVVDVLVVMRCNLVSGARFVQIAQYTCSLCNTACWSRSTQRRRNFGP